MKLLSSIVIFALLCAALGRMPLAVQAQTTRADFNYDAELVVKTGGRADKKPVVISHENGNLKIRAAKGDSINKSFAVSTIKSADYTYSEKPQIKEALLTSILFNNLFFLGFLLTKTKKHWLVMATETEVFLLQLRSDNYRRLLLDLNARGVPVEDLGDRDRKERPPQPPANFIAGESCRADF